MLTLKKIYRSGLLIFLISSSLFIISSHLTWARENVSDWYIEDFKTKIEILNDDSAIITEDIVADCGSAIKHGIFRILPVESKTPDGVIYSPIELISITDFNGKPYQYQTTRNNNTVTWKIGNQNINVSGKNNYRIQYRVDNIIREQAELDELYWNLSGNYWDLEIDNFKAEIILPPGVDSAGSEIFLYSGSLGEKNNINSNYTWLTDNILAISTNRVLAKDEGVTISLSFPKGYITHQIIEKKNTHAILSLKSNPFMLFFLTNILISPIIVFIIAYIFYRKKQKQNIYHQRAIVTEYVPPEDISPIMLAYLDGKKNQATSITASIVRMAVLKLLVITEKEKKILFSESTYLEFSKTKTQENYHLLDQAEKYIFQLLFKQTDITNSNKLKISLTLSSLNISQRLKAEAKNRGFLLLKNDKLKRNYLVAAIILFLLFSFLSAIILIIFYFMSKNLSEKGQKIYWQVQGFKRYLTVAEKERHSFYEQENIFTKFLPYSIAIGSVKKWAKKMKAIYGEEYMENSLYWYAGASSLKSLSKIDRITNNINSISHSISSSTGSSSGMSGGGFSGGGGGGGGGGGW